jgi:hypothetical protein
MRTSSDIVESRYANEHEENLLQASGVGVCGVG